MGRMSSEKNITNVFQPVYDRVKELKAFDDTKIGVKGLVDSGAKDLPKIFIRPPDELSEDLKFPSVQRQIPVISFEGIGTKEHYDAIVKEVLYDTEAKKEFNTRDMSRQVLYISNYDLYKSHAANWRDSLAVNISNSSHLAPEELPKICRFSSVIVV
ncbi:1-aminocyclopropane-1-carboxylate oxidase homolog 3-like [Spinacia oleracea]|uniref:1-aminocyclopropane-1-carboxylate oxidase homolog 3-like n=1 Tax=Spinacia oleracea TaxID=3562 RepID=A0ABM3R1R2_SPIOL|nr:1-aminocyclopropane-1-carboxylate oxidase homolog 3-like [Spinacia oleracea]